MADTYSQEDLEQYITRMVEDEQRDWSAKQSEPEQVLCRDCKYHVALYAWDKPALFKCTKFADFPANEFDHCSYGERRKEE